MYKKIRAYVFLILAMVITGSLVIAGKVVTQEIPIMLASMLRFLIATVVFLPVFLTLPQKQWPQKKEWQYLSAMAFLGIFIFNVAMLNGLKLTSTANSAIILGSEPVLTALMAYVLLREKLSLHSVLGILLASIGMMILQIMQHGGSFYASFWGDVLIFISVWGGVSFNLFSKKLSQRLSPLANSAWLSFAGLMVFLPNGLWELLRFNFAAVSLTTWLAMGYYAVIVTVVAFLLWYEAVKVLKLQTIAVYTTLIPLSTLAMSILILKETLLLAHVIGAILIVGAIVLVSLPEKLKIE